MEDSNRGIILLGRNHSWVYSQYLLSKLFIKLFRDSKQLEETVSKNTKFYVLQCLCVSIRELTHFKCFCTNS